MKDHTPCWTSCFQVPLFVIWCGNKRRGPSCQAYRITKHGLCAGLAINLSTMDDFFCGGQNRCYQKGEECHIHNPVYLRHLSVGNVQGMFVLKITILIYDYLMHDHSGTLIFDPIQNLLAVNRWIYYSFLSSTKFRPFKNMLSDSTNLVVPVISMSCVLYCIGKLKAMLLLLGTRIVYSWRAARALNYSVSVLFSSLTLSSLSRVSFLSILPKWYIDIDTLNFGDGKTLLDI